MEMPNQETTGASSNSSKKNFNYKNKNWKDKRRKFNRREASDDAKVPEKNDYLFYAASDEIAKDVASIPFNYLGGTDFKVRGKFYQMNGTTLSTTDSTPQPLVSVARITYTNSIGKTIQRTQGANMAAVQLYTAVRHKNSGARNYEAADMMMYILEIRDIISEFFACKKIVGMVGLFNYYNHNLPNALIHSEHIQPIDLRSNIAQYRGRLNLIAKKINSFAIPKYFKMFDRAAFINSYVFTDSSSIRGQFYNFVRAGNYYWNGTKSEQGTSLEFKDYGPVSLFSERLTHLEEALDSMFLDEDALTMSGDILKAFGEGELYTVAQTPDDYIVPFKFDEDVLAQIENMHIAPFNMRGTGITANLDVTQKGQIIKFAPQVTYTSPSSSSQLIMDRLVVNSHKDNPDYKDVLEWTRLMAVWDLEKKIEGSSEVTTATLSSSGLEIVWNLETITLDPNTNSFNWKTFKQSYFVGATVGNTNLLAYGQLTQFDWHPFMYVAHMSGSQMVIEVCGDVKVGTTIGRDTLDAINDAAVYGALYGSSLYNSVN